MPELNQAPAPILRRVYEAETAVAVDYELNAHATITGWVNEHRTHEDLTYFTTRMEADFHLSALERYQAEVNGYPEADHLSAFVSVQLGGEDRDGKKVRASLFLDRSQAEDLHEALGHAIQEAAGQTKLEV